MGSLEIPDEIFLEAWMNNSFDAKAAYLSLRPKVTPDSAATLGMRKLAACKASGVYQSLLSKAYRNVSKLLDSENEEIMYKQSKDLIDRTNGKAQERIDLTTLGEALPQPLLSGLSNGLPADNINKKTPPTKKKN